VDYRPASVQAAVESRTSAIRRVAKGRNATDLARRQVEMFGMTVSGIVAARTHHIPANPTTKRDASDGSVRNSR
jgi:hypothetical protein